MLTRVTVAPPPPPPAVASSPSPCRAVRLSKAMSAATAWVIFCMTLLFGSPIIRATPLSPVTGSAASAHDGAADAELQQVKYMVGLLKGTGPTASTFFRESASAPGTRIVSMTSHTGKKFKCAVPDPNYNHTKAIPPPPSTTPSATSASAESNPFTESTAELAAKQRQQEEHDRKQDEIAREKHEQQQSQAVPQRIKSKLSSGCFTKQVDFWTYEVCPYKSVRQYHKEGDKITIEFNLGAYLPTGDLISTAHAPYTQHYSGGSSSRQSQVRFLCADTTTTTAGVTAGNTKTAPTPDHVLTTITEPTPHHYEFEIRTILACKKPYRPIMKNTSPPLYQQVLDLLEPLKEECLYMNANWWTYKFCYLKDISQFHRENVPIPPTPGTPASTSTTTGTNPPVQTKVVTTAENSLGIIPTTMTSQGLQEITTLHQGTTWQLSYVAQQYTDGAFCDLSKKPRTSEVRFYCDPLETTPALRAVEEIRSCEYILTVRTHLLCQHHMFAPSQAPVKEIVCTLEVEDKDKDKEKYKHEAPHKAQMSSDSTPTT